jgi:tRNA(Ser,Leu) C12 N-acetylase TAN1
MSIRLILIFIMLVVEIVVVNGETKAEVNKEIKLMAELIDALASPKIQSEQSFSLIQKILGKFYPQINDRDLEDESFKEIVASI